MGSDASVGQPLLRNGCACGWSVVGTADEVVTATQEHGLRIHNMLATREEVLSLAVPVAPEAAPTSAPDQKGSGERGAPARGVTP